MVTASALWLSSLLGCACGREYLDHTLFGDGTLTLTASSSGQGLQGEATAPGWEPVDPDSDVLWASSADEPVLGGELVFDETGTEGDSASACPPLPVAGPSSVVAAAARSLMPPV